jgi:hypothetical protein
LVIATEAVDLNADRCFLDHLVNGNPHLLQLILRSRLYYRYVIVNAGRRAIRRQR